MSRKAAEAAAARLLTDSTSSTSGGDSALQSISAASRTLASQAPAGRASGIKLMT